MERKNSCSANIAQLIIFLVVGVFLGGTILFFSYPLLFPQTSVTAIFSPEEGAEIVKFISSANSTLDIEVYTFSSEEALNAVLSANDRGVKVRIILERDIQSSTNQNSFNKLKAAGISIIWASDIFQLTHSKFIIVDGKYVLVGSHNLSENALTKNREASVILSGSVVSKFLNIFEKDWSAS